MAKVASWADVDRELEQLKAKLPDAALLEGHLVADVDLDTTTVKVAHKLGRLPQGYVVVRQDAGVSIWEDTAANSTFLYLQASGPVTVSLWVF